MPEPSIVKITISEEGGTTVFPETKIQANDTVFWLNKTSQPHQPAYKNPQTGQQILWGPPPSPLGPRKTSSQVQFATAGKYSYYCTVLGHSAESGEITVLILLNCASGTATVDVPYSSTLSVSGHTPPDTYSITSGSLPDGLTLNSSSGAITGTPATAGTYNFTANVVDSVGNTGQTDCTIVVASASANQGTTENGIWQSRRRKKAAELL